MSEAQSLLPHSLGKISNRGCFCRWRSGKRGINDAGADFVGMEDLAEKFKKEEISSRCGYFITSCYENSWSIGSGPWAKRFNA